MQLLALEQEVTAQQNMVDRLLEAQTEQDVATRLSDNQVEILQPPEAGIKPVNIRPVCGAPVHGGDCYCRRCPLLELTATRIVGLDQAATMTDLHPLAVLPLSEELDQRQEGLHFPGHMQEALNTLRTALTSIGNKTRGYVLEVTSAAMGDGKSTVASG